MAVYVDPPMSEYFHPKTKRRMVMCHMTADSRSELLAMADRIGVARKWIQKRGTIYEHFDVCFSKRKLAIQCGALEITLHEAGNMIRDRRCTANRKKGKLSANVLRRQTV